jgi:hypothetical protein
MIMATKTSPFENKPCSRCGGSGHYSFNLMHGSTCYGCSGRGYQLTARGAAASGFYKKLMTRTVDQLQPGDYIWEMVVTAGCSVGYHWGKVISTDPTNGTVTTAECTHPGTTEYRVRAKTNEERDQAIAKALEYQGTLTLKGEPSKRKAVKETTPVS